MPGCQAAGYHKSNQNEYWAQIYLSALGVASPVPRQEDIGIDFYCALSTETKGRLTFHSPFAVQVGSEDGKDFSYGGFNEKGRWKDYSSNWLFSQELPLFIGTVEASIGRFQLYSTSAMWLPRYQFGDKMAVIELCPGGTHDPLKQCRSAEAVVGAGESDGYTYNIPLGAPVVELFPADIRLDKLDAARAALAEAATVEQKNITFRRLGTHAANWFPVIKPNDASSLKQKVGEGVFFNDQPGRNIEAQIDALQSIATVLALNLGAQNDNERIKKLAPVFRLFSPNAISPFIEERLPGSIREILPR